ncbi:MAG: helix-turn-helix domain-containing protein [Pyrinomonadaceae bacterium]
MHDARSDYAVLILLKGHLRFSVAENSGILLPDQSLLIGPSCGATATGQAVDFLLLTMSPAFLVDHAVRMGIIGQGGAATFRLNLVEGDNRLAQMAISLASELTEEKPGRDIVLGALVEQIAVQLLRHYSNMRRSEELELSRVGLIDRRIRRSVELMHAQLEHDLSLKEIAAASYLSPFHFVRVFKKLTGTTPHAYLASLRTARAQLLLAEPNLSVTEISSRVGYSSPSHFTKAFRQATGLAPRAFRKALISR